MMQVEERSVDSQGRVSLPSEWRKRHLDPDGKVYVIQNGEEIIIKPVRAMKISEIFDAVPVDVESDLGDWDRVKRELLKGDEG
jgi:AbrB family looped-hinge helix DNA binding protein